MLQRNWKTPTEFPACPNRACSEMLSEYATRLEFGIVFRRTPLETLSSLRRRSAQRPMQSTRKPIKEWAVTRITIEDDRFVHEAGGTYFSLNGALKEHCKMIDVSLTSLLTTIRDKIVGSERASNNHQSRIGAIMEYLYRTNRGVGPAASLARVNSSCR